MRGTSAPPTDRLAVSRRAILKTAALGTAALGSGAASALLAEQPAEAATRLVPNDPDLHLLRRATYGPTTKSLSALRSAGRDGWLARQLEPGSIGDPIDALIKQRFPRLSWSMDHAWATLDFGWDLMFDLGVATLARACWSERQLFEVMVDFWSNHLNVTNPSDGGWYCRHDYDQTVIRKHALGKFSDMLTASASHPAMLFYLNNAESTKDLPNENYGRELLELHTVGIDAGYSEDEMYDSTLIMTGFTIDWDTGAFRYSPDDHHTGRVKVLGFSAKNVKAQGGHALGLSYLRYLSRHPSTARHIAFKLCQRFIQDDPPEGLVGSLASTYLRHDTAIVPVLQQLFASGAFASSIGQKVRRPTEDVAATIRILGIGADRTGVDGMQGLYWMVDDLANAPMAWHPPNGYPDTADAWRSAGGSLGRWNAHMSLAAGWWPNQLDFPDLIRLLPHGVPKTYGALVDQLAQRLLFDPLSKNQRGAVLGFLGHEAGDRLSAGDEAVGWRFPYLVSLILDAPSHMIR